MDKPEILKLIEIRNILIREYKLIPGREEPNALIKAQDVAVTLDKVIKRIDRLLSENNVIFGE
jgi:uncharacterized protein YutE (UPF0331/DUF86 family)